MAPQLYVRFLIACASDPRFTADNIMAEIAKNYALPPSDRMVYRMIIPFTRRAILRLKDQDAWMNDRPDWGKRTHRSIQPGQVPHASATC